MRLRVSKTEAAQVQDLIDMGLSYARSGWLDAEDSEVEKLLPFTKHCGVCEEDDAYFGMPVSRAMEVTYQHQGANQTELVAITPPKELGLPSVPALWKAGKDEDPRLVANIGGAQYTREEAAYLFDRAFTKDDEHLVPLAYVTTLGDEGEGAVLMFSRDHEPGLPVTSYDAHWLELGAAEDYAMGQTDRQDHNWLTHPDDPHRPLFIDNGLCAPTTTSPRPIASAFIEAWGTRPLSPETVAALKLVCEDRSLWLDLEEVIGREATNLCKQRCCVLRDTGQIPQPASSATTATSTEE